MGKGKFFAVGGMFAAVALTAVFVFGGTASGSDTAPEPEELVIPVAVVNAETRSISVSGEFVGTVEPGRQIMVMPKLIGEVISVEVEAGDIVEAGDVLCRLDAESLEYSIAQTSASLANARQRAELGIKSAERAKAVYESNMVDGEVLNSNLSQLKIQISGAKSALEGANIGYSSARRMYRDGHNAGLDDSTMNALRDQLAASEVQRDAAQANLEELNKALEIAEKAVRDSAVDIDMAIENARLAADLSSQYIALDQLRSNLDNAVITAPISGVIERRLVDPLDIATSSAPVFIISDKSSMLVTFKIPEGSYSQVRVGDKIIVEKDGETCNGTITEIGTAVENMSGLFTVKAAIENPLPSIHNGSVIKLFADIKKAENVLSLPINIVQFKNNNTPYVFVEENGLAVERELVVGLENAEYTEIISGIGKNDKVIATWHSELVNGVRVSVDAVN